MWISDSISLLHKAPPSKTNFISEFIDSHGSREEYILIEGTLVERLAIEASEDLRQACLEYLPIIRINAGTYRAPRTIKLFRSKRWPVAQTTSDRCEFAISVRKNDESGFISA